jgi:hypothetical protein
MIDVMHCDIAIRRQRTYGLDAPPDSLHFRRTAACKIYRARVWLTAKPFTDYSPLAYYRSNGGKNSRHYRMAQLMHIKKIIPASLCTCCGSRIK